MFNLSSLVIAFAQSSVTSSSDQSVILIELGQSAWRHLNPELPGPLRFVSL